jgi:NCAIR mutase (PurE)-related protein
VNPSYDLDLTREARQGFPEVVYGESKTVHELSAILAAFAEAGISCLVTRLWADKAHELVRSFKDAAYDPISRTLTLGPTRELIRGRGTVVVLSGGTSDLPIAAEIMAVLKFLGIGCELHQDKGIAGLHRLLALRERLESADVIICVAGFEGALASVVSGLVACPVIGVPTSIGYGVAQGGDAALRAMLASCANGLMVVNIDNGYGAAIAAFRILARCGGTLKSGQSDPHQKERQA